MKKLINKMKGKKVLSMLLALIMVLTVCSPAFSPILGIIAKAADEDKVELAFNNLFIFEEWANNSLSGTVYPANAGTLVKDITNGSFQLTANGTAKDVYTRFSNYDSSNVAGNANFYTIDVEPSTAYMFFYNLSNNLSAQELQKFSVQIFMFDESNAFIETGFASSTATALGDNGFTFTTTATTDRIQIRFTLDASADDNTTPVAADVEVKNIKLCKYDTYTDYTDYDNLFVFDKWASNSMSGGVIPAANGTLTKDFASNSFVLTADGTTAEVYTGFSMFDSTNVAGNAGFYTIDVEPSTVYNFSYNANIYNGQTLTGFSVLIFEFNESDAYIRHTTYAATAFGNNSFLFATDPATTHIQVRFTLPTNSYASAVQVKNIKLYEYEGDNLFDLDAWANDGISKNSSEYYPGGTAEPNTDTKSIAISTNDSSALFFTHFTLGGNVFDQGYYTIDVEPSTTYTFSYTLVNSDLPQFQPYFCWYDASGNYVNYGPGTAATDLDGCNIFTFTTAADAEYITVVFSVQNNNLVYSGTVADISITAYDPDFTDFTETTEAIPHRQAYSFGTDTYYGTLPTPKAPDGYVFAGWTTNEDGTGKRFTATTAVENKSYTVYPRFEPAVDTLKVTTMPVKTEYTLGERLNTTGLVLTATQNYTVDEWTDIDEDGIVDDGETETKNYVNTFNITSGYYCTPEYLTGTGTQTIIVSYGGQNAEFTVEVSEYNETNIPVNDVAQPVTIANNEYTFNYTASEFNRYELTYYSNSYVKGTITMGAVSEDFFLEPSSNGSFASYIDGFLDGTTQTNVATIKFTCLDNDFGDFELLSVNTINETVPDAVQYFINSEYEVGISLNFGGVVSSIKDLDSNIISATYSDAGTEVGFNTEVDTTDATDTSDSVNLINTYDRGRYLQQSYYGTSEKPYEMGDYNGLAWNYNPVQGGNLQVYDDNGDIIKGNESSKVIDYRITDTEIYVKTRPLDWGKNSTDYPDSYNTPSYMEAWYTFDNGMIKVSCRFVDYSGYPSATTTQELPALYTVEPLNNFVYYEGEEAWADENEKVDITEPDFWGVSTEYNNLLAADGQSTVDPKVQCVENWAAFTREDDENSFGIGVYSPGITEFHYGTFPAKYNEEEVEENNQLVATTNRHATTTDPASENPTSYIAPVGVWTMESYTPFEYSYYITTGTAEEIRTDFMKVASDDAAAEYAKSKVAVPETVYMTPADGESTIGQYYVNNILDESNYYNVETVAESADSMYFGLHIADAESFSVNITNVTNSANDINLCDADGNIIDGQTISFPTGGDGTFIKDNTYNLNFSDTGLNPGETATAKWEITVTLKDGTTETYTAYTVMYAPERTVGAVAEARQVENSQNEISSWITGANGVDHSQRSPLGSLKSDYRNSGYFRVDPLVNPTTLPTGGSSDTSYDYILGYGTPNGSDDDYHDNAYVMQTATSGHDSSRAQSYLGLLTVDGSRYTNTDQIPNLKIGYDVLRIGSYEKNSLGEYTTYYTLGTESAYTATDTSAAPSGWTVYSAYTDLADDHSVPYRESFVPSYDVSTIDGKYIHALNQGKADQTINTNQYSTAGTSVLCSVTDKSELRDSVLNGYTQIDDDPEFVETLEIAATVLGDPSATQEEIDAAKKDLDNALEEIVETFYALKYDNLFSAYEFSRHSVNMTMNVANATVSYSSGAITVNSNGTEKEDVYSNYNFADAPYLVTLEPDTEYVYEYDVVSDKGSQAFLFFYNEDGSGAYVTDRSVQVGSGNPTANTENVTHFGNYTSTTTGSHYVVRFTTPGSAIKVGFRFGNINSTTAESTFSNIRLVEADKYYTDVEGYTKTEDVYKEYASYGTLPTLSRAGYTFAGWSDVNDIGITGATIATEHRTIYSQWNEHSYTIVYNANGGSGSISQTVNYTGNVTLPADGFTNTGYKLIGWSTSSGDNSVEYQAGQTVSGLTAEDGGTITLYAVWAKSEVNVTFDNLMDLSAWGKLNPSNASATFTQTDITLTSNEGAAEGTFESPEFAVTAGKDYKIDIDFEGDGWDVYVFFRNDTTGGTGIDFSDETNRFSSNGSGNQTRVFTAPAGATKAVIRIDANGSNNTVKFSNIRVWEDTGITVSPVNKVVGNGNQYGTLPTPTRVGYTFNGWKNANDEWVNENDEVNSATTVNLYSDWTEKQYGIFFNTNGGSGEYEELSVTYSEKFVLPDNLTAEGAKFLGWSLDIYDTSADYAGGETISVSQLEGINADNIEDVTFNAVWELTEDSVVEDSAVIDFGLALTINPYNNDTAIFIYHASTVAKGGYDFGFSTDNGATLTTSATGAYGNFSVDKANFAIVYTPTKTALGVEEVTLYSKLFYGDGSEKTLTNTVRVVPASNVYYEETVISTGSSTGKVAWNVVSNSSEAAENAGVYGYDNRYESSSEFSNNSNYNVSVDSVNKRSETASFTFTGTGFDLVAACGSNTGVQLVNIRKDGTLVKGYIVDTYYDTTEENPIVDSGLIYQTPIVNWTGDYGTYTVEITAYYLASSGALQKSSIKNNLIDTGLVMNSAQPQSTSDVAAILADAGFDDVSAENIELVWFDDNSVLNGGTGATSVSRSARTTDANGNLVLENYIDGIRVYNALNKDSSKYSDIEKNAVYANIVNSLVTPGAEVGGIAYISGGAAEGLTWETYQKKGPKGEIYLNSNNAVTFQITVNPNERVMIALRAVNGATKFSIGSTKSDVTVTDVAIGSATEMYYDITDCIGTNSITEETEVTVTVTNSGDKILAVNHVKFSGGDGTFSNGGITPRSVSRSVGATTEVTQNRFLPLTEENIVEAQNSLSKEAVQGVVENGVVVLLMEEETPEDNNGNEGEIPGDEGDEGETPEVPGDNSNEGENGSSSTDGAFGIFSLIKWLIELIKRILYNTVGNAELL